jgi:hypothetical protein
MGKGESKIIHMIPSDLLQLYVEEYKLLGLTHKDICLFHNIFLDLSSSQQQSHSSSDSNDPQQQQPITVTLEQVCHYFALEQTSFTKLLFQSFDVDLLLTEDGSIDFPRFLQAIWNFCSLDDESLSPLSSPLSLIFSHSLCCEGYFIFNVYDRSRDDYLSRKDIAAIVTGMYGSEFYESEEAIM